MTCYIWLILTCIFYIFFNLDDDDVCYTSVSGFVFLRFFAPAILNPKLFQMRNEHPVSKMIKLVGMFHILLLLFIVMIIII